MERQQAKASSAVCQEVEAGSVVSQEVEAGSVVSQEVEAGSAVCQEDEAGQVVSQEVEAGGRGDEALGRSLPLSPSCAAAGVLTGQNLGETGCRPGDDEQRARSAECDAADGAPAPAVCGGVRSAAHPVVGTVSSDTAATAAPAPAPQQTAPAPPAAQQQQPCAAQQVPAAAAAATAAAVQDMSPAVDSPVQSVLRAVAQVRRERQGSSTSQPVPAPAIVPRHAGGASTAAAAVAGVPASLVLSRKPPGVPHLCSVRLCLFDNAHAWSNHSASNPTTAHTVLLASAGVGVPLTLVRLPAAESARGDSAPDAGGKAGHEGECGGGEEDVWGVTSLTPAAVPYI
eukprot:363761-Chlamydomonas_euryale.AAC.19